MTAPYKGESPVGAGLTRDQGKADDLHSAKTPVAAHALRVIEGERKAHEYLARLQASHADPDELAVIVAMLYGATLRGFCRVLAKALGVNHA
jgi:hypothetical protein